MANTLDDKKERINKAYDILYDKEIVHSKREFAELLGKGAPNLNKAMNGHPNYLTDSFLASAANSLAKFINTRWLRFGEGTWEACSCEEGKVDDSLLNKDEIIIAQQEAINNLTNELREVKSLCKTIMDLLNK